MTTLFRYSTLTAVPQSMLLCLRAPPAVLLNTLAALCDLFSKLSVSPVPGAAAAVDSAVDAVDARRSASAAA